MLKNLLLGMISYDDGTKKLVIKWFGAQECARWAGMSDKNAQFSELNSKWNE